MSQVKHEETCRNCQCGKKLKFCGMLPDGKFDPIFAEGYTLLEVYKTPEGYKMIMECPECGHVNEFKYEYDW